jgi:hypothetical protein
VFDLSDLSAEEEASDSAVAINISQMRAQQQVSAKLSARSSQHTPPYPDGPTLNSLSIGIGLIRISIDE